jgi:hypothetical protein
MPLFPWAFLITGGMSLVVLNLQSTPFGHFFAVLKVNDYKLNNRFPEMWFIDNCQSRKIRSTERFPRAPIKIGDVSHNLSLDLGNLSTAFVRKRIIRLCPSSTVE